MPFARETTYRIICGPDLYQKRPLDFTATAYPGK